MNSNSKPHTQDRRRFPVDPWKLVEKKFSTADYGRTETLFTVGNGYLGMRANPEEGREAHAHGTFINGFHETWPIHHAEDAFGLARTGQTVVNVPDTKVMKLYVDDEPLLLMNADLDSYERVLDFRSGVLSRDLMWRTPAGWKVSVRSRRMVSFEHRHLAVMSFEVTAVDRRASVVVSSQLLNRQDGEDEYHVATAALGEGIDPRKAGKFDHRVLDPQLQKREGDDVILGYRCANSRMTIACGYRHVIDSPSPVRIDNVIEKDLAKTVFSVQLEPGQSLHIIKLAAYHTSTGVPAEELADRCRRTLDSAAEEGTEKLFEGQRAWLDDFWKSCDIEVEGNPADQQALRWNLFQLAQAAGRAQEHGIAAKGLTSSAYEGHYFWDSEIYVLPFLSYTKPEMARKALRFRWQLLQSARHRAAEMNQKGALYPWRTINGQEASAFYAAGTAQYHINAAVAFALKRYVDASGDLDFLAREGAEILVETARLWDDLGFYALDNGRTFHIHKVTGPDEYTTVVNDNFYTNVMAKFNLKYAAETVKFLAENRPEAYSDLCQATALKSAEVDAWIKAADSMYLPYDQKLGIHPQDSSFLELERWNFENIPRDKYPLFLHFHPLVIHRYQVLKQTDVVLALFLMADQFPPEQKRKDFDYYDPITTGDSSLSACVQAIVAAQIGYHDLAWEYFSRALYLDLDDLHGNTADGVHIASAGGVWAGIVYGFAGFFDDGDCIGFEPNLPDCWKSIRFRFTWHGRRLTAEVDRDGCTLSLTEGGPVALKVGGKIRELETGGTHRFPVRMVKK